MPLTIAGLVLASAGLHLAWNLGLRQNAGRIRFVVELTWAGGAAAALATLILRIPLNLDRVWPWLLATIAAHVFYFLGLSYSYRDGALGDVYPVTRGGGILGTALAAGFFLHQSLDWASVAGVVVVAVMVMIPGWRSRWNVRTLGFVALVALTITVYSTVDSHGVHLISPIFYIAVQYLGTGTVLAYWGLREPSPGHAWRGMAGGVVSALSYVLVLFAYQRAPAAPVLALRQVSIALAPLAGWVFLKERLTRRALWVSLGVAAGATMIVLH